MMVDVCGREDQGRRGRIREGERDKDGEEINREKCLSMTVQAGMRAERGQ